MYVQVGNGGTEKLSLGFVIVFSFLFPRNSNQLYYPPQLLRRVEAQLPEYHAKTLISIWAVRGSDYVGIFHWNKQAIKEATQLEINGNYSVS